MANIADENTYNPERTLSKVLKRIADSSVAPDFADLEKLRGDAQAAPQQQQPASNNERVTKNGTGQDAKEESTEQTPAPQKRGVLASLASAIEVVETAKAEWQRIKGAGAQQSSAEAQSALPEQQPASPAQAQQGGYAKVADKLSGINGALKDIGSALKKAGVGASAGPAPSTAGKGTPQPSTGPRTPGGCF